LFRKPLHIHDPREEKHERQVETRVQALLASVDVTPLEKVRPCDIHKLEVIETKKGLWTWWYSKRKPQASSKKTTGISDIFI
jgi:hypothetical protein